MEVPILNKSEDHKLGIEIGLLFAKVNIPYIDEIKDKFHVENLEQILIMIPGVGWKIINIIEMDEEWYWMHIKRRLNDEQCSYC